MKSLGIQENGVLRVLMIEDLKDWSDKRKQVIEKLTVNSSRIANLIKNTPEPKKSFWNDEYDDKYEDYIHNIINLLIKQVIIRTDIVEVGLEKYRVDRKYLDSLDRAKDANLYNEALNHQKNGINKLCTYIELLKKWIDYLKKTARNRSTEESSILKRAGIEGENIEKYIKLLNDWIYFLKESARNLPSEESSILKKADIE